MPDEVKPTVTPPVQPKPLDSFLKGADLSDFGEDDPEPVVQPAVVAPVRRPKPVVRTVTRTVEVSAQPVAEEPEPEFDEPEVVPVPTVPVTATQEPVPVVGGHDPKVLAIAERFGFGPEDAELYTPDELRLEVLRLKREEKLRQQAPALAPAPAVPEPVKIDWGTHEAPDGEGSRPWTDDDLSPAVVKAFKDQKAEIAELKKQLAAVSNQAQQVAVAPLFQQVKAEVAKYGAFFGGAAPVPGTPEHQRCLLIIQGLDQLGKQPGHRANPAVDVPRVIETIFGIKPKGQTPATVNVATPAAPVPAVDPELAVLQRGYQNGQVQRPTNRNAPQLPKGEKRAKQVIGDILRAKGFDVPAQSDDDEDSFG